MTQQFEQHAVDDFGYPKLIDAPNERVMQSVFREIKRLWPHWTHPKKDDAQGWRDLVWEWRCNLQGFPDDYLLSALLLFRESDASQYPCAGHLWITYDTMHDAAAQAETTAAKAMAQMRADNPKMFKNKK